jgi:hypothetical protein
MREDYPIYVQWFEGMDWILERADAFPKAARGTVTHRIVNLALDVLEGIVEAIYTKERSAILRQLNLNIEKLRVLFGICHRRRYLSIGQYEHISRLLDETGRMAGGWEKSIETKRRPV